MMVTNIGGPSHVSTVLTSFSTTANSPPYGLDTRSGALEGAHVYMTIGHGGWPLSIISIPSYIALER
jgi:hypothetical protein